MVEVSPSTLMRLKLTLTVSSRAVLIISGEMAQSVVRKQSMVPMLGCIMPLPLATPPMRTVLPPTELAKKMASDGEGARHLITCTVQGAKSEKSAETIAKSVVSSTLTKAAIFGADANWGRVLCAMGYSGEDFDPDQVNGLAGKFLNIRQGLDQGLGLLLMGRHAVRPLYVL